MKGDLVKGIEEAQIKVIKNSRRNVCGWEKHTSSRYSAAPSLDMYIVIIIITGRVYGYILIF